MLFYFPVTNIICPSSLSHKVSFKEQSFICSTHFSPTVNEVEPFPSNSRISWIFLLPVHLSLQMMHFFFTSDSSLEAWGKGKVGTRWRLNHCKLFSELMTAVLTKWFKRWRRPFRFSNNEREREGEQTAFPPLLRVVRLFLTTNHYCQSIIIHFFSSIRITITGHEKKSQEKEEGRKESRKNGWKTWIFNANIECVGKKWKESNRRRIGRIERQGMRLLKKGKKKGWNEETWEERKSWF